MRRLSLTALPVAALLVFAAGAQAHVVGRGVRIAATTSPWAVADGTIRISGTVTPHPAGVAVTLQQRQATGWLSIGDKQVRSDGAFSFVATATKPGLTTYRVVTATGTSFSGSSAPVPVRVLHWQYVTSIDAFAYVTPISGDLTTSAIDSNGVHYEHPIALDPGCYNQWSGSAWIDYLLQRQYRLFSATVGLDDAASSGATATYSVIGGDGKQLASGSLVPGAATRLEVSVAGEYRLRLRVNVPDPNNASGCSTYFTHVVFGDARLLGP